MSCTLCNGEGKSLFECQRCYGTGKLNNEEEKSCCRKCKEGIVEETRPITTAKWRKSGWDPKKVGKKFDTIDFILYSKNAWRSNPNVLKTPEEPLEKLLTPGWKYPSDHWMIAADLEFLP